MVIVCSGNDRGKIGKVLEVSPKEGKIIVQGVHLVKKHVKPRPPQENGGITEVEGPIYASKVQLWCDNCKAGRRSKHVITYEEVDGKKTRISTRVCAKCGKEI